MLFQPTLIKPPLFLTKFDRACKNLPENIISQIEIKMKKTVFRIIFLLICITSCFGQEAKEIVKKADEKARGKTSISNITIQTIRPSWSREMTIKAWSKGNDYSMIL